MKFCSNCGTEAEDSDVFCGNCGYKFLVVAGGTTAPKVNSNAQPAQTSQPAQTAKTTLFVRPEQAAINDQQTQPEQSPAELSPTEQPPADRDSYAEKHDYSHEPTKKKLHRLGGFIFMMAFSNLFGFFTFINAIGIIDDASMGFQPDFRGFFVCGSLALLLFVPGAIMTIVFAISNKKVKQRLMMQHCEVDCPTCHGKIQYNGLEPIMHHYKYGYVPCPKCGTHLPHRRENIYELDGEDYE